MEALERCNGTTRAGAPCPWAKGSCRWHGTPEATGGADTAPVPDVRSTAWQVVELLLADGAFQAGRGSAVISGLRLLASLGEHDDRAGRALAEVELRGLVMNGRPPRDAAEWALATEVFGPEAAGEMAAWEWPSAG